MSALGDWIRQSIHQERIAALDAMTPDQLKSIWDRAPDDGYHVVDGHDLDDVHFVLNMKGHGHFCTV